jgi:hypothetical protein
MNKIAFIERELQKRKWEKTTCLLFCFLQ